MRDRLVVGRSTGNAHELELYRSRAGTIAQRRDSFWIEIRRLDSLTRIWYDVIPGRESDFLTVFDHRALRAIDFLNFLSASTAELMAPLSSAIVSEVRPLEWSRPLTTAPSRRRATYLLARRAPAVEIVPGWFATDDGQTFSDTDVLDTRNWLKAEPTLDETSVSIAPAVLSRAVAAFDAAATQHSKRARPARAWTIDGGLAAQRSVCLQGSSPAESQFCTEVALAIVSSGRATRPHLALTRRAPRAARVEHRDDAEDAPSSGAADSVVINVTESEHEWGELRRGVSLKRPGPPNTPLIMLEVEPGAAIARSEDAHRWIDEMRTAGLDVLDSIIDDSVLGHWGEYATGEAVFIETLAWEDMYSTEELERQAREFKITLTILINGTVTCSAARALADVLIRMPKPVPPEEPDFADDAWLEAFMLAEPGETELFDWLMSELCPPPVINAPVGPAPWTVRAAWPTQRVALTADQHAQRDSWMSVHDWINLPAGLTHLSDADVRALTDRIAKSKDGGPSQPGH